MQGISNSKKFFIQKESSQLYDQSYRVNKIFSTVNGCSDKLFNYELKRRAQVIRDALKLFKAVKNELE